MRNSSLSPARRSKHNDYFPSDGAQTDDTIRILLRDYCPVDNSRRNRQFNVLHWPRFDANTSWSDYKRMWVAPAIRRQIPFEYIADKIFAALPSETAQYVINSIPDRDDVDSILQSLDLMFHTNITSKSSRRSAERELEDCKRSNDELIESFGKRLLHLLAKAYPATDAATTNALACKLFLSL